MIRTATRLAGPSTPRALARSISTSSVAWRSSSSSSSASGDASSKSSVSDTSSSPKPQAEPSEQVSGAPLIRESSSSPEEMNTRPLPYLSFALGVPFAPSSNPQSWADRKAQLLSDEHRMASRKSIVKEATRGYFHDFHAIKSHGGKTWRAPNTMIKEERAMWFPRIEGARLSDRKKVNTVDVFQNKVSVVSLLNSKISEEHTKSFYEDAFSVYGSNPKFQLVQLNLQTNVLKSFMVSLFLSSLKAQIAQPLHSTYLFSTQDMELEKDAMGFHNKHVGYTYLVDQKGRIRWAGCAFAEPAETKALTACTGILLERKPATSKK